MSLKADQERKSIEVALDHALSRLNSLEGEDRLALANGYKEWLSDTELPAKIWFSADIRN